MATSQRPHRTSFAAFNQVVVIVVIFLLGCKHTSQADETQVTEKTHKFTNDLIHSSSPYLLQHAHNPVNWMPWGPEAFTKAKRENKPIFVSIGYSTCYWCHVMERESFENEEVAKILNANYVTIKVDREERPDIDEQLMLATQLMTGRGGWPNSIFLTTDGRPWMAGTYFPRPQFISALNQLSDAWKNQADAVQKQADSLSDAIRQAAQLERPTSVGIPAERPVEKMLAELEQIFDAEHGGFGDSPKFPPHGILRVLALQAGKGNSQAQQMLNKTLDGMWCGGVHDHVGGGFHRYSTDERWLLPHFEKMLYDNGQLMRAYADAYEVDPKPQYKAAIDDIYNWLMREMTHERGGFFSAIDSESEGGEEGRYYTWSIAELENVLTEAERRKFVEGYHLEDEGNFAEEATQQTNGTNIPYLNVSQIPLSLDAQILEIHSKLQAARSDREYPHLDDKILTSWNGLMISALAKAGAVLDEPKYVRAAGKAADFILNNLRIDGKLMRTWRGGKASLPGYLNDYAFFTEALIELHEATAETRWRDNAKELAIEMLLLFEDQKDGGLFFTSQAHEQLLLRSKNLSGGGNLPNGNGVAASVLIRLSDDSEEGQRFAKASKATLHAFSDLMLRSPRQVEHLVLANSQYAELLLADNQVASSGSESTSPSSGASDAEAQMVNSILTASLYQQRVKIVAGESAKVAVQLRIREPNKLYGPRSSKLVQPTTVEIVTAGSLTITNAQPPKGKLEKDPVLQADVETYKRLVTFSFDVSVPQDTPLGKQELRAVVSYQACDKTQCFAPATLKLPFQIEVAQTSAAPLRHPEIFTSTSD